MVMKKKLFVIKLDFTILKFLYNSPNSNVGSVKMKIFNKFVYFLKHIYLWGMRRLKTLTYVIVLHNIILKIIFNINVNFNIYCKEWRNKNKITIGLHIRKLDYSCYSLFDMTLWYSIFIIIYINTVSKIIGHFHNILLSCVILYNNMYL